VREVLPLRGAPAGEIGQGVDGRIPGDPGRLKTFSPQRAQSSQRRIEKLVKKRGFERTFLGTMIV
jgi:hypothetical protein